MTGDCARSASGSIDRTASAARSSARRCSFITGHTAALGVSSAGSTLLRALDSVARHDGIGFGREREIARSGHLAVHDVDRPVVDELTGGHAWHGMRLTLANGTVAHDG